MSTLSTYKEALEVEIAGAEEQSRAAVQSKNVDEILVALDRLKAITTTVDSTRVRAVEQAKALAREAILAGVHYRQLYGRPLSHPIIIDLAKELGIDVTKSQPIVRRT